MAAPASSTSPRWRGGRRLNDGHSIYWWVEVLLILAVYVVYSTIRNASTATERIAFENALLIIDWQDTLWWNHELAWQELALRSDALIIVSNYFYGSAYMLVTLGALVFLYLRFPADYPLWRNTLAAGTLLALVGFFTFPLMPPRLLDTVGSAQVFGFVDTLKEYPTFWSFDSELMESISNQYAAMPSLHCGWAFWAFAVFWPRVRTWWAKGLTIAYPVATVVVVVITGNHFFLDAVGGAVVMGAGFALAVVFTRAGRSPGPADDTPEQTAVDTTST